MSRNGLVIAIDGPSASGKSTTAKLVAHRLGYTYIDSGAMYRAVTLAAIRAGIDPADASAVEELAAGLVIRFRCNEDGSLQTLLNGEDVSGEIRTPEVTSLVSQVSTYAGVRNAMVELQRAMSREGGVVLDGRDIGTVVFPNADVKVFMVADIGARASRRREDMVVMGEALTVETIAEDLERRDYLDSHREISPLRKAEDAVQIDTSGVTIEQQVEQVLDLVRAIQNSTFKSQNEEGP